jgi:hypothetical protein
MARLIGMLGLLASLVERVRIARHATVQARLRRRFAIALATPILGYGPEIERLIAERAARLPGAKRFALTSGSSATPKRLVYTPARLRATKLVFVDVYARACRALRIRRRSLFVLSPLAADESLTAQLLAERRPPSFLATLQAPYRLQSDPAIRALADRYGATAVRLFLIATCNPGVLYATNPSTLSTFLDAVADDWPAASALARDYQRAPGSFPSRVAAIVRRLDSRGAGARRRAVADSATALPLATWAPAVEATITWTGGYVAPFVERLATHLPPDRYRLVPMYSMSTETIETVSHFEGRGDPAFLPLAPGVLYEFLPEEEATPALAADQPSRLLTPDRLETGRTYTLVVSDDHGLRRYQTADVFLCRGRVRGLPDLSFVRRRGLEHSFTGEKLTAEQAAQAFAGARRERQLPASTYLSLVPSWPAGESIPHYKLAVVTAARGPLPDLAPLAAHCQATLEALNPEYRSKVASRRLAPLRPLALTTEAFARAVGSQHHADRWEAQFKFLPLYRATWESLTGKETPPAC